MINVTLTGNVYDENENLIDCYYDVYYKRQNILVTGLRTELNQYNFNIGSVEHLTQNGDLKENDVILIRFNTLKDTEDLSDKFSSISVIYNNINTIVKDVQLKNINPISCNFNLETGNVNETIHINVDRSLDYSWTFRGNIMYQRKYLYSYEIFPDLIINNNNILYDFVGFWTPDNSHVYDIHGLKTIMYKINLHNINLECSKIIRILKNEPIIEYDIPNNIKLNDSININVKVIDSDDSVINIKHYFNNELLNTDMNPGMFDYTYTQMIGKTNTYRTEVIWNDGFEDRVLVKEGTISTQNQAPTVNPIIEYINNTKNNIKIIPNSEDPENEIDYTSYKVYIRKETIFEKTNEIDYTWIFLDILESNILDNSIFIDFYKSGNFKIEVQTFDKGGLGSEIKELFIDIECQTSKDQCSGYFDWSKTTSMLKFKIEEQKLSFRIEEQKLNFKIEEQKLNFRINEEQIKFKIAEENIKFSLNCSK